MHKEAQRLTHLGNWSWDIGAEMIEWSDEMYRIYGLEPQSEQITFERFRNLIHPDNREQRLREIEESLVTGIVKDYTLKIVSPQGEIRILRGYGNLEVGPDGNPRKLMGTCQDITDEYHLKNELIALNQALSVKNSELMNSNKELESFNYIASHDLQEPLRKIQLFIEKIMLQGQDMPDSIHASLEKVVGAAARMRQLIHDLMEFSQISLSRLVLEDVDSDAILRETLEPYSDALENGQLVVTTHNLPIIRAVRFQFSQLITNLLSNAIKYGREDSPTHISATGSIVTAAEMDFPGASGRYIKITISDNGIGFDPAQKEHIFELFKRLHGSEMYTGTGIGLAICKKIVQNHRGFISADSAYGEGSRFHIYLPH